MPVDFTLAYKRLLKEILTISHGIRHSAVEYVNNQNINVSERLRSQLETIRISADTILEALTKASLTTYTLDDRVSDWLTNGGLHSCLDKLRELDDMLKMKPDVPVRPGILPSTRHLGQTEDKLTAAMVFFDKHKHIFHFLLTADVWDRGRFQPSRATDVPTLHVQAPIPQETCYALQQPGIPGETTTDTTESGYHTAPEMTKKEHLQQKLDQITRWLAPVNSTVKHNDVYKLRQEGTCMWFPSTDAYQSWRLGGNKFLWLHGKAGCGKSVLVASTIEHLKTTLRKEEVVIYFYCDFRTDRSTSATEMMRSLLAQLLYHFSDNGVDPGDLPNRILEQKSEGVVSLGDLDKLCDLVSRAATCFGYYPIVVVDALDECVDIGALLPALLTLNQGDVRLLVTSRPHQIIKDHFGELQSLSFEDMTKETAGDIALHISREIDIHEQLRSADQGVKDEIGIRLNEMAEGRFRWVQCQLDALRRCASREELRETLHNLPNELEVTYERILGAIDERNSEGKLARRTLSWLVVAMEPLRLAQLIDGFSIDMEEKSESGMRSLGIALLHALSSLVAHSLETDILVLSHFTVKEYLASTKALPTYQIISHEAHAVVAEMCMHYTSVYLTQAPSRGNTAPLKPFPMLSYVLSSGFYHLSHVDPQSKEVVEVLKQLGSDVRHHPSHWEFLCELREVLLGYPYPPWPSSRHDFVPYILVAYSSPTLLQSFLSGDELRPRIGTNSLVYAADLRKTEHAVALLECGADVNWRGFVIDDSHYALPLEVATDRGDDVLVGELLRKGCEVTPELLTIVVCMPWCSTRVLVKLMRTNKFIEWAHEIGDERLYRSVFNSARPNAGDRKKADEDHVELAQILRRVGVDLPADSPFGVELIERAVHAAHISMLEFLLPSDQPPPSRFLLAAATGDTSDTVSVVRFLLNKGVDVNAASIGRGDTALHLATMCPWEPRRFELMRMLIDAGCNPHALNKWAETPLTIAVQRGYSSAQEILLSCRVPPSSTILHHALHEGWNLRTVQLLIIRGANVHIHLPNSGNTLLHLALAEYHESRRLNLLHIFIKAGCNPSARNARGQTALDIAIEHGYTSAVDLLLVHDTPLPSDVLLNALELRSASQIIQSLVLQGADMNSTTFGGDPALHLAISYYAEPTCLDLVKIFVVAGCDLAQCNRSGQTALDLAIIFGRTSVVDHLLSHDIPIPSDMLLIALRLHSTTQIIQSLIFSGADVHPITSDGDSVLHLAITRYTESTCLHLVDNFVKAGCGLAGSNSWGQTALEVAIHRRYTSVVDLLFSHDAPIPFNILLTALQNHLAPQTIRSMVDKGADLHTTTTGGNTVLHLAIVEYDESTCLSLFEIFLEAGSDPTTRDSVGKSVLEVAIERGYISAVESLLSNDVPMDADVLLFAMRHHSNLLMVQFLTHRGADVHSTASDGGSILHLAITEYIESTCLALASSFIEAGCDPAAADILGQTALDLAIHRRYTSVVELLLLHDVPLPHNVLQIALRNGLTPRVIRTLIQKGADVHFTLPASDSSTVLHLAVAIYPESTCLDLVCCLVEAGCGLAISDVWGDTVLDVAIQCGYTSIVELLLLHDAKFNLDILPTALRHCLTPQIINSLIHKGANIHSTYSDWSTVLHLAVARYPELTCLDLLNTFIGAGCNLSAANIFGQTALDVAVRLGYESVVELLVSHNALLPPSILKDAVGSLLAPPIIKSLILKGADIHFSIPDGISALHLAIACYPEPMCLDLLDSFIEAGCNLTARDLWGQTVLDVAAQRGHTSAMELLLSRDVPLHITILPIALWNRLTPQIIQSLIVKGADVHRTIHGGYTVLHLAVAGYPESTCFNMVSEFIMGGCSLAAADAMGKTVLDVAIHRGYTTVVDLLLSHNAPLSSDILLTALGLGSVPQIIQSLLLNDADIRATMPNGDTILHLAINEYDESTCSDLLKIFIEAGSNPTTCNTAGKSVLEVAIEHKYISAVELLLSSNVPMPVDILSFALQRHLPLQMVQFLVQKGADVHFTGPVLRLVVDGYTESTCLALINILIDSGCTFSGSDLQGQTVLDAAAHRGFASVVERLLSHGAPFHPNTLLVALWNRLSLQIAQSLIAKGADVRATTLDWESALHLAIARYPEPTCIVLVNSLIDAGCDLAASNLCGETGVDIAVERGFPSVAEILLLHNVPFHPTILPIALRNCLPPQIIRSLILKGADVYFILSDRDTLLLLAIASYAESACLELVKHFIDIGCDPAASNHWGETGLDVAIDRGYISVVDLLLSHNVVLHPDILLNVLKRRRSTPSMMRFLVSKGASVGVVTSNGDTVLHLAIAGYHLEGVCWEMMKIFIDSGCDPVACNFSGQSVLELAIERGYTPAVELLFTYDISFRHDVLQFALQHHSTVPMIELLAHKVAKDGIEQSWPKWDDLLQFVNARYSVDRRQEVIGILDASRKPGRAEG